MRSTDTQTLPLDEPALFDMSWLPDKPLCAPAKTGPYYHRSRDDAKRLGYIEVNPACMQSLIVTDVDITDIRDLWFFAGMPEPSWMVGNAAEVVTGHIGYALHTPVCLTDAARRRPINLLARIETGLIDVFGGDVGYSGRITKNPLAPGQGQFTLWGEDFPTYGLKDLAAALDNVGALPKWDDPRPRLSSGIGRNIDLFNSVRRWSYKAIKNYWHHGFEVWAEVIQAKASMANEAFALTDREPLPDNEVRHLARSIAWWVWQNFTPTTFNEIQHHRGIKSGNARKAQRDEKLEVLLDDDEC